MENQSASHGRRLTGHTPAREFRELVPLADRLVLSETEAAALIGVSRWAFRKWKAAGLIAPIELPLGISRNLYRRSDVLALVGERDPRGG